MHIKSSRNIFLIVLAISGLIALNYLTSSSPPRKMVSKAIVEEQANLKEEITDIRRTAQTFSVVAKAVKPAVVHISTQQTLVTQRNFNPLEEFFFGTPRRREFVRQSLGSGVIVSQQGYVLTNNHVVANADKIKVTLADKKEFNAKVVGSDPKTDVAVIKIDDSDLPIAKLGDSDKLEVGDWVIAIGTPFGLAQTVTVGIISAKGRANVGIADYEDFLQTDAAINPGNSGGPLVSLDGTVIGINTAIFSQSGGYQGIGFAIPINMAKEVMYELIEKGEVVRGWLGVVIQPVTQEIAEHFKLKGIQGALIAEATERGPAYKGGLRQGDIILEYNDKEIKDPNQLRNLVAGTPVGKKVKILVFRFGSNEEFEVGIEEEPIS
ncbi:MAG: Do family serine endopeptidase [Nitrospinae bacterium]|nr:Do family serine endopeptidase [Nitrospinota bacterium]